MMKLAVGGRLISRIVPVILRRWQVALPIIKSRTIAGIMPTRRAVGAEDRDLIALPLMVSPQAYLYPNDEVSHLSRIGCAVC